MASTAPFDRLEHESAHGHFHIGLSRTDPHLAQHHVVEHDFPAIADSYGIGASGFVRSDFHRPSALGIGLDVIRAAIPRSGYAHAAAGRSLAPEIHFRIALQHHIAPQHGRKFHFGFRLHSQQQSQCSPKKSFHNLFIDLFFFNDYIITVPNDKVTFFPRTNRNNHRYIRLHYPE